MAITLLHIRSQLVVLDIKSTKVRHHLQYYLRFKIDECSSESLPRSNSPHIVPDTIPRLLALDAFHHSDRSGSKELYSQWFAMETAHVPEPWVRWAPYNSHCRCLIASLHRNANSLQTLPSSLPFQYSPFPPTSYPHHLNGWKSPSISSRHHRLIGMVTSKRKS